MAAYLVEHGPLAIAADAAEWQFYIGGNSLPPTTSQLSPSLLLQVLAHICLTLCSCWTGVFDFPCGKTLDHGILITGYGVETDIWGKQLPYWIVKNSWVRSLVLLCVRGAISVVPSWLVDVHLLTSYREQTGARMVIFGLCEVKVNVVWTHSCILPLSNKWPFNGLCTSYMAVLMEWSNKPIS